MGLLTAFLRKPISIVLFHAVCRDLLCAYEVGRRPKKLVFERLVSLGLAFWKNSSGNEVQKPSEQAVEIFKGFSTSISIYSVTP